MGAAAKIRYSFQPGPSQLHPQVESLLQRAFAEGLFSRYHRDPVWKSLFARAQSAVAEYLGLPEGWLVFFVSSATEAWQVLVDATAERVSLHLTQGAFGERWYGLQAAASGFAYRVAISPEQPWPSQRESIAQKYASVGFVGVVQVETSVGATLPEWEFLRETFPRALIAVDATSSLGAISLPWEQVDIVFASVQKGFGLPPGLAVVALGKEAQRELRELPALRYNSLSRLIQRAEAHEPPFTPNLIGLYLLAEGLPQRPPVREGEAALRARADKLYKALEEQGFPPLQRQEYRSPTVLALRWPSAEIGQKLRSQAEAQGLYLGWGYGEQKDLFFRIANFPALPDEAFEELLRVLQL